MTATTISPHPTIHPVLPEPAAIVVPEFARPKLLKTGALAGLTASAATVGVAAIASALDVPLTVGGKTIPLLGFAQLTFIGATIGTAIAVALSRRATRPRRPFLVTTVALALLSIVPDAIADAHTGTKLTLALTHVVAAAIVIPALASRLTD